MRKLALIFLLYVIYNTPVIGQYRWKNLDKEGILWTSSGENFFNDHIEMSGEGVSAVIRYSVASSGSLNLNRSIVWPSLRTLPNNTHASLMHRFGINILDVLTVNGLNLENDSVKNININGFLSFRHHLSVGVKNIGAARLVKNPSVLQIDQTIFPSINLPLLCERYVLKNISNKELVIQIPDLNMSTTTDPDKGKEGAYKMLVSIDKSNLIKLKPNETYVFYVGFEAGLINNDKLNIDYNKEWKQRLDLVNQLSEELELVTPDSVLNQMFRFAKIRAAESIYKTKGGLMHGPGGESYYAAIWANDQAEYVNPLAPFFSYNLMNEAALNSFRHFARFMNNDFKPIPSSIIAEGFDIWNGVGDRGDAAMIAYGASRYALGRSDVKEAEELWGLIEWCLEFCRRKVNSDGVVESDTDELEGRFPAGKANLSTSALYYDALNSAVFLGKSLGKSNKIINRYIRQAKNLEKSIERYFGAEVSGFNTYRYYEGNDLLRSWISIPLTVDIFDRKEETIAALLSPKLFSKNGLLTQEGSQTFWDRSTLYTLRGLWRAGKVKEALESLKYYSGQRLLGDHVPYAIEAWPEGNQRHLSAESGLYCRIYTEGMFGIRPIGLKSFSLKPHLPDTWSNMELKNIGAFGGGLDIKISKSTSNKVIVVVSQNNKIIQKTIENGSSVTINL